MKARETVYFSPSSLALIPGGWKMDGTYTAESWPADSVLLSDAQADRYWRKSPPMGQILGATDKGQPIWVSIPPASPLSASDIERYRLRSYADPLTGSDRLFSESLRMQIMGESGHEEVRARAIARFGEIQTQYPWPSK